MVYDIPLDVANLLGFALAMFLYGECSTLRNWDDVTIDHELFFSRSFRGILHRVRDHDSVLVPENAERKE